MVAMEEEWVADRARLRQVVQLHPDWSHRQCAEHLGRSVDWVKDWRKRLATALPDDETVLHSRSRARKHPPPPFAPAVIERILAIRDEPPENLRRTPGPRAILYYLHRDAALQAQGVVLPRAASTIWRILSAHGRLHRPSPPAHQPVERPAPYSSWQMDFKDASTVPADPDGKQQHVVEVLDIVDMGTSLLVAAQPGEAYRTDTVLPVLAQVLEEQGLPDQITFDRDPRFVGSPHGRDFPSPFVRFWLCLGVLVTICPPRRPDKNAFVERYQRSYGTECLAVHRPTTLAAVREVTATYKEHYNGERPNQAVTCGNRPPRHAFPELPPRPSVPLCVDPDGWLQTIEGQHFVRKVRRDGSVTVASTAYYIKEALSGQYVTLQVHAADRAFVVWHHGQPLQTVPIKGLVKQLLSFEAFVEHLCGEARLLVHAHGPALG